MRTFTINELYDEYTAFITQFGYPEVCAEELMFHTADPDNAIDDIIHLAYLEDFIARWNDAI